ncbi:hypothetical protein [Prescottella equi]|uniref:ATP synthase beta subunit C-terminal domain-containing protein n=1 Tax=Rhodococcus hoagii TaxID=43767 RepID=UPI003B003454
MTPVRSAAGRRRPGRSRSRPSVATVTAARGRWGEGALGPVDRAYRDFAACVRTDLLDQRSDESRTLDDTLDRAWAALARLPRAELTMLPGSLLDARYRPAGGGS